MAHQTKTDGNMPRAELRPLHINFELYTEGDQEYKKELTSLLIANVRELQKALPEAIQQHNHGLFHDTCHKVKVTLSMLEDEELNRIVEEL